MNPSDWIKAAALVTQHKQEATMAEMDHLSSMPLSEIAIDDNSLPVVHYGKHVPVAASSPAGTDVHIKCKFLSTDYPRYPTGFIIPCFIIT